MNILIVEDEHMIAKRLRRIISELMGDKLHSLSICSSIDEGMAFLSRQEIDLLFLDLNLNGEDGFVLLESMVAASFHTIIVSAYKEKAIQAFEYGVLDFVPKPFRSERIAQALGRSSTTPMPAQRKCKYLAVQKRGRTSLFHIQDLMYIQGAGIYSELCFKDGNIELHNKSLDKLSSLLPPEFDRIHKSYIVNNTEIRELLVQSGSKYTLILRNGSSLPVGRTRYKALKEKWAI
ncbi:MAG: LytTR family DNA-binding domain-containing protein [Bacteroidota bacterium]